VRNAIPPFQVSFPSQLPGANPLAYATQAVFILRVILDLAGSGLLALDTHKNIGGSPAVCYAELLHQVAFWTCLGRIAHMEPG
jgi:hypothetical protein